MARLESVAPGHLPEPDRRGEGPAGEGGQPGAAGPGREHSAARRLPARSDGLRHRNDQRSPSKRSGAGP